jgi:hypothetical protein
MTVYITQLPYGVMNSTITARIQVRRPMVYPCRNLSHFSGLLTAVVCARPRRENGASNTTSAFEYRVLSTNIWPSTCFVRDLPRGLTMTISRNCALLKRLSDLPWRVRRLQAGEFVLSCSTLSQCFGVLLDES